MKHTAIALAFLLLVNSANAQSPEINQPPSTKTDVTKSTPASNREVTERRARARSLLLSLSTDARTFRDQTLRARSLARIADALWQVDPEQARLLFRKAWEAAEVADQESDRKLQEEISKQKIRTGGGFAINLPPNVRREVLKLAARHDRVISEEFLEKLKTQKVEAANSATSRSNPLSDRPDEALSQRLGVADEYLRPATQNALYNLLRRPSASYTPAPLTSFPIYARRIPMQPILLTQPCSLAQLSIHIQTPTLSHCLRLTSLHPIFT